MQLPGLGQFGNAIAPAPQAVGVQPLPAGQGLQALGGSMQAIAGQEAHDAHQRVQQADHEARQRALQAERARTALALAQTNNALHDAHDTVARGVADGSIDPTKAGQEFEGLSQKAVGTTLKDVTPEQRQLIDDNLATTTGSLGRSLNGVVIKRQQSDTAATIDEFSAQMKRDTLRIGPERAAGRFDAMVDFTAGAAGWNPEVATKKKQAFREEVTRYAFTAAGMTALQNGSADELGQLVTQVLGPAGEPIDPLQREALAHKLMGYQQHIVAQNLRAQNAAEAETRQRHNEAVDIYNKGTDILMGGGNFSPEFIDQLTTAAAGTDLAKPVLDLVRAQPMVAGFSTKPAAERTAMLERLRAARATPGVGTDPDGEKLLKLMTTMDDKLAAGYKDNPWETAAKAGVLANVQTIDPANPAQALEVVGQRMKDIGRVELAAGRKVSPLQPQEVDAVGKMVRALPLDQAATMLGNMGAKIGNGERIAALAKQIGDKDEVLGMSMMYANAGTSQGRTVAELLLRGERAIKDKAFTPDPAAETGWRAEIAKAINGTFSNADAEEKYKRAAYLILAAKAAEGDVNTETAVKLATGGIIERNGQKIPLPYGMQTAEDFDRQLRTVTTAAILPQAPGEEVFAGSTPIPLEAFVAKLPRATLMHAGQGLYNVRAGSALVTNAQGRAITIQVKP